MSFNFGAEPVDAGGKIAQAAVGQHEARVLGILHLGMVADEFQGKKKDPAPFVCVLFELKSGEEAGGVNDDGSPIVMHKSFPLKRGDKASLTKFMKVMLTPADYKKYESGVLEGGFDDFIGQPILVDVEGSKKKNDAGDPMYTNISGFSKMPAKLAKVTDELVNDPIGHITLDQHTEDTIKALPPFEIYGKMEQAINYPGSKAEEIVEKIRETQPEFGTKKDKGDDDKDEEKAPPEQKREDLDESEDFS